MDVYSSPFTILNQIYIMNNRYHLHFPLYLLITLFIGLQSCKQVDVKPVDNAEEEISAKTEKVADYAMVIHGLSLIHI